MKATFSMGNNLRFEIEGDNEKALMYKAISLANPPKKCDVCGKTEGFYFSANMDKEDNVYVKCNCPCGASSSLGTNKGDKGYFWKRFEVYIRSNEKN